MNELEHVNPYALPAEAAMTAAAEAANEAKQDAARLWLKAQGDKLPQQQEVEAVAAMMTSGGCESKEVAGAERTVHGHQVASRMAPSQKSSLGRSSDAKDVPASAPVAGQSGSRMPITVPGSPGSPPPASASSGSQRVLSRRPAGSDPADDVHVLGLSDAADIGSGLAPGSDKLQVRSVADERDAAQSFLLAAKHAKDAQSHADEIKRLLQAPGDPTPNLSTAMDLVKSSAKAAQNAAAAARHVSVAYSAAPFEVRCFIARQLERDWWLVVVTFILTYGSLLSSLVMLFVFVSTMQLYYRGGEADLSVLGTAYTTFAAIVVTLRSFHKNAADRSTIENLTQAVHAQWGEVDLKKNE
jgi:hypothetical protein